MLKKLVFDTVEEKERSLEENASHVLLDHGHQAEVVRFLGCNNAQRARGANNQILELRLDDELVHEYQKGLLYETDNSEKQTIVLCLL